MTIKYDVNARYGVPCAKSAIGVALLGAAVLLLAGCSSLFDSPPGEESVHQEAALSAMNRLVSTTPQDAANKAAEHGKAKTDAAAGSVRQHAADASAKARSGASASGDAPEESVAAGWETPSLSFERVNADMPQLAVWGLEAAKLLVDGEEIELGKMTRAGRIALLAVGRHVLQVKCPFDPPFSADFRLTKGDRVVLRGRCSSGRRSVGDEGKRN